jgi:putative transcriptional regulator
MKKNEDLSPKGAEIVAALAEFCDVLKSGDPIENHFTVRTVELAVDLHAYTPEGVKRVRDSLGLSQPIFARFLGVGVKTVRSWEQGARTPSTMACRFLSEIESDPDYWRGRFRKMVSTKSRKAGSRHVPTE